MKILIDSDSERGLLAGLMKHGGTAYHNITDIGLSNSSFNIDSHKILFQCLEIVFKNNDHTIPDIPSIYSAASELGKRSWFQQDEEVTYLNSLFNFPIDENNIRQFALKIRKLEIGRLINERLEQAKDETLNINGNESINEIFGIVERGLLDCGSLLSSQDKTAVKLSDGMREYFLDLEKNPIEQVGLSTGFPIFDDAIGGGLRNGSVDVVGARMSIGKSTLATNIALNIAAMKVPVLILDSEMGRKDSWTRLSACLSQINNRLIETGQYGKFQNNINKVHNAIDEIEKLPLYFESIAGLNIENQISIIKRWLITEVKIKKNGTANPCLIIYDYLKLMDPEQSKGYQEYQLLGFLMTTLVNLAQKYKIPIFALIQLNRDGLTKEDTSIIAQSDRIAWFASSLSIFKTKDIEELNMDGYENGNRKLIVIKSRFGPGLKTGDYINFNFNGSISKITEGKTKYELFKDRKQNQILIPNEPTEEPKLEF